MKLNAMRSGLTLVEVALAGAIATLLFLAMLEGLVVAAKISHENAQLLAAEGYAWETAWRWLNKSASDMCATEAPTYYPTVEGVVVASNECPMICRELTGADAKCYVRVQLEPNMSRNGGVTKSRRIDVNVEWGPASDRRCLTNVWPPGIDARAKTFNLPITVYKSETDRGWQ